MPRISQAQTQERNAFLLELIRSQPDISRQEAQERFEEKFDSTLNPKTFHQLREQVQQERTNSPAEEPSRDEHDAAEEDGSTSFKPVASGHEAGNGISAQPAKVKAKGARQKNVFVDASKEQLVFLERIIQQLQEAGASNVRIDHSTDRWMVLVVDAK
ncbi:MAG TPA: hypothetical protein VNA24_23510 [Hyalangium sp.]|nr:hypothetical protein [Hyalangium sp.]